MKKVYEVCYRTQGYGRPTAKFFDNLEEAETFFDNLGDRASWLCTRFNSEKAFTSKNRNMIKK